MFGGILAFLIAIQTAYVPEPPLKIAVFIPGPRCACRTDEVRMLIDGIPIRSALVQCHVSFPSEAMSDRAGIEPWRVVLPADHFMREMVLSGEWIETRPRLRATR